MSDQTSPDAHQLLAQGIALAQNGMAGEAFAVMNRALALKPDFFDALYNRGLLLCRARRFGEALASLDQALIIKPDHAEAWHMRGNVLRDMGHLDEALTSLNRSLADNPDSPGAYFDLGQLLLRNLERPAEALAAYDKALALAPDFVEALSNRSLALRLLNRHPEAMVDLDRVLALRPDDQNAWISRGQWFLEMNLAPEAMDAFQKATVLGFGADPNPLVQASLPDTDPMGEAHKKRHDREQRDYQLSIAGKFAQRAGARLKGLTITPNNKDGVKEWATKKTQIAVIDNLLTPEALEGLRRFCLEEPIWRKPYRDGYLGAFPEQGFACPLLAQIAEELRTGFPEIFGNLPLHYLWGFKYDSRLTGINIHADEAAVNVNFWLTPDEANLDPQTGGLVVWDVAAPLDWDFTKFNTHTGAMREFLSKNGAKSVRVPYRANRAVIFDSDLFHETDTIRFKDGYLNRRMNVTMLYGQRWQDPQSA